jgi:hypothetical protein
MKIEGVNNFVEKHAWNYIERPIYPFNFVEVTK